MLRLMLQRLALLLMLQHLLLVLCFRSLLVRYHRKLRGSER
jgi:hypothetical protein